MILRARRPLDGMKGQGGHFRRYIQRMTGQLRNVQSFLKHVIIRPEEDVARGAASEGSAYSLKGVKGV